MHASKSLSSVLIESSLICNNENRAYIAVDPLQCRSFNVGVNEQFLQLITIPRYLYSLTISKVLLFMVYLFFSCCVP